MNESAKYIFHLGKSDPAQVPQSTSGSSVYAGLAWCFSPQALAHHGLLSHVLLDSPRHSKDSLSFSLSMLKSEDIPSLSLLL